MRTLFLLLGWLIFSLPYMHAQPVSEELPQITGCIALKNARVITDAAKDPVTMHVIMRDGLIKELGPNVQIPVDAYVIAADSLYVYPAFIDACAYTGVKDADGDNNRGPGGGNRDRPAVDEEGNPSLTDAGITPFQEVRTMFDATDKSISDWRAQGFGVAHIVPRGKMIPGKGALVVLSGTKADNMIWRENISMYGQWNGAGGTYPSTVIAVMAKWRELYQNASQEAVHLASYGTGTGISRPQYNQAHTALIPVVKREMPLFFRAPKIKDISRALALQQELGMRMVITDAEEAWMLKQSTIDRKIPLVLSLHLPEDKSEKKEDDKGKKEEGEKKDTTSTALPDPEKQAFEKRRAESLLAHQQHAATLAKASIPFSFGTLNVKPGDFSKNMQVLIEQGLDPKRALHALTMQPAQLLGIDTYCGSIATGKMANVIVSTKPMFEKDNAIRYMIVEGHLYEYEVKEKKKPAPGTEAKVAGLLSGTWNYTVATPDQNREGTMTFTLAKGEWTGTITGQDFTTGNNELEDIVVDGSTVSFVFDFEIGGQAVTLEFDLSIDGESFNGDVTMESFGSFPITGTRTSKPE